MDWHRAHTAAPYTIKEAALLYESGSHKELDYIIVVTAPEAIRLERVVKRDQSSAEAVRARMAQQMPETEKIIRGDYLIFNDGHQLLIPQVMAIHKQLFAKYKAHSE
jgi:dephospho-CoA kinase